MRSEIQFETDLDVGNQVEAESLSLYGDVGVAFNFIFAFHCNALQEAETYAHSEFLRRTEFYCQRLELSAETVKLHGLRRTS